MYTAVTAYMTYRATAEQAIDHPPLFLFAFAAARFAISHKPIESNSPRSHQQLLS